MARCAHFLLCLLPAEKDGPEHIYIETTCARVRFYFYSGCDGTHITYAIVRCRCGLRHVPNFDSCVHMCVVNCHVWFRNRACRHCLVCVFFIAVRVVCCISPAGACGLWDLCGCVRTAGQEQIIRRRWWWWYCRTSHICAGLNTETNIVPTLIHSQNTNRNRISIARNSSKIWWCKNYVWTSVHTCWKC